jgi:hypothetical protein
MVSQMLAAGVPHETIVLAIRTAEITSCRVDSRVNNPPDNQLEKRRAWDREYRRRTRHPPDNPPDPPDSEVATISVLEEKDSKKEKKNSRGSRIPPDWNPNEVHYKLGSELGFDRLTVDSFGEDMRLWAEANANRPIARKLDWDKTFSGWLRRQKPGAAPPVVAPRPPTSGRQFPSNISREDTEKYARHWNPSIPEGLPPDQWKDFKNGKAAADQGSSSPLA